MTLTREDIVKVYDELDRRMELDIYDGTMSDKAGVAYSREWLVGEYEARMQGVYGTLMALVPNDNWCDIVTWIREIEYERYAWVKEEMDALDDDLYDDTYFTPEED